jgi:outer membrane protein insertion porin family
MGLGVRIARGLVCLSLALGGALVATVAFHVAAQDVAAAETVQSIVVQGNRRIEAETVRSYFKAGPNGQLSALEIDEGLKALIATGLFEDVRIGHSSGRLVVTVVEAPVINRVAFEGNKKAKDDQLSAEVQSKPRGSLSRAMVQADVQRIIEIYHRSGRFDVSVDPKIIELPNNRVDLVFEIKEGPKTGIKSINFVGNRHFSGSRLKDVIKTSASNFLSFLQTTDIYDPDRLEADRDLLRRFYLKHGFADVRILSASGVYDPSKKGFIITFTIDEGEQYRVGTVRIQSNVRTLDEKVLRSKLRLSPGQVYNADMVDKTIEGLTIEAAKRGYAFAKVEPHAERNYQTKVINLSFTVDEGARVYIERINIHGNTRTRDYVIRREFDIGEGDAYNRALIDRAERRLNNLNYFKKVKITNEPGSAPDRIVIDIDVVEKSTGNFSVAGGYSTAEGFISELSVTETNLMGRGQYARAALRYGEYTRGIELNFAEPYFLGYRVGAGIDLYWKENEATSYISYATSKVGTTLRLVFPLSEGLSFAPRYSIYQQDIDIPDKLKNCNNTNPDYISTFPTDTSLFPVPPGGTDQNCYADGEANVAAKKELEEGPTLTSALGYTLTYNTLDNNKTPTSGMFVEFKQDLAGLGGDVNYIRSTIDVRQYAEVMTDVIGLLRVQAGHIASWGGKDLRMLDHFQNSSALVRGFAPGGFGPRDMTCEQPGQSNANCDPLGGSLYWAATAELQTPLYFLPKEVGVKLAGFVDAGSLWDYKGPTSYTPDGQTVPLVMSLGDSNDGAPVRASAGIGLLWDSPLGPIRFDFAFPFMKESYDKTQWFRFSGGTSF